MRSLGHLPPPTRASAATASWVEKPRSLNPKPSTLNCPKPEILEVLGVCGFEWFEGFGVLDLGFWGSLGQVPALWDAELTRSL